MAYEMAVMAPPEPPQPTRRGGSAVQSAVDSTGQRWVFDNEDGIWVNEKTGESLTPKEFSQKAGRTGDASVDTSNLAASMRGPVSAPAAPIAAVAPPMAVVPPQGIIPPSTPMPPAPRRYVNPEQLAGVMAQRPVASTIIPPSPDQLQQYKQQMAQWLVRSQGWKPADAMKMSGVTPPSVSKPIHVGAGSSIVDPVTGKLIYTAPGPQMTELQRMRENRLQAAADRAATRSATAWTPSDTKTYTENATRLAVIKKELDSYASQGLLNPPNENMLSLRNEALDIINENAHIKAKYSKPGVVAPTTGTTTIPAPSVVPVTPPGGTPRSMPTTGTVTATARVKVRNPQGKVGTIPASQLDDAIKAGWKKL